MNATPLPVLGFRVKTLRVAADGMRPVSLVFQIVFSAPLSAGWIATSWPDQSRLSKRPW